MVARSEAMSPFRLSAPKTTMATSATASTPVTNGKRFGAERAEPTGGATAGTVPLAAALAGASV